MTLSLAEVWLCVGMSALVAAAFILFYNKIFAVTFDEAFARATGTKAGRYNLLIAIIVAAVSYTHLTERQKAGKKKVELAQFFLPNSE